MHIVLRLLPTIGVVSIAAWIAFLQAPKRTRVLAFLLVLLALLSAWRDVAGYLESRPRPRLVLYEVDSRYDRNPPKASAHRIRVSNSGAAEALNVAFERRISIGDSLVVRKTTSHPRIDAGQIVGLEVGMKGELFNQVWSGDAQARIEVAMQYEGPHGVSYVDSFTVSFKPNRVPGVFDPTWIIEGETE